MPLIALFTANRISGLTPLKSQMATNPPTGISVTYVKCKLVQGPRIPALEKGRKAAGEGAKAVARVSVRFV